MPPTKSPERRLLLIATFAVLEGSFLLLANILAVKIIGIGPIRQDGGVLVFVFYYIGSDLLIELFGRKLADRVALICCLPNLVAIVCFMLIDHLPCPAEIDNVEMLSQALGFSARIMLASTISAVLSQMLNNFVFEKIKQKTGGHAFWKRSLISSFVARTLDAMFFNVAAFAGRMTIRDLGLQIIGALIIPSILEVILNPIAHHFAIQAKNYLSQDHIS